MLHSMTGFARQSTETAPGMLTWELRTVNHRYLDIQFRLPDELRPREPDFRQQVSARLSRGKIECGLHFRRAADTAAELEIDRSMVDLLSRRAAEIARQLPDPGPLNPIDVLRWPGVVQQPELDAEPLFAEASGSLERTLDALTTMRSSEGARIAAMIESRIDDIAAISASVRQRMPAVLEAASEKQRERIARLDVEADPARLEVELALIAQKLDVDEELDRLDSHVVEIRGAIEAEGPIGRRLDFLMQELNREANTLGSKSGDTETTRAAVDLKVLIEQMREQVQNVE